ncbi:MAG: hypothetical protein IT492_04175 [Gammaproteobacteria bacterium]|nr:hypothetical protein [Gammaproteobacteria bacterium]
MSAVREEQRETLAFPHVAWFEALARLMNVNRARQEQLGYIDCSVVFTVSDGSADKLPRHFKVSFEEFEAVDVREVDAAAALAADFGLEASLATWRKMIESIAAGGGRPALDQTLNYLSHMGTPLTLVAADPLQSDLYYRYNQSLQEFVNASAAFDTEFPLGR